MSSNFLKNKEIEELFNKTKSITDEFIKDIKNNISKDKQLVLEIPEKVHEVNKTMAILLEEKVKLEKSINIIYKKKRDEIKKEKSNMFISEKDIKSKIDNIDVVINRKFKISYIDYIVGILKTYNDDIIEIRMSINAYSNLNQSGI